MQVKQAIELLKRYDPEEYVIMAWWDHTAFENMSVKAWEDSADWIEDQMDWSYAHDQITNLFDSAYDS